MSWAPKWGFPKIRGSFLWVHSFGGSILGYSYFGKLPNGVSQNSVPLFRGTYNEDPIMLLAYEGETSFFDIPMKDIPMNYEGAVTKAGGSLHLLSYC